MFAVFTDFLAAAILRSANTKAALETFIIAIFVIAGNYAATWLTSKMS